MEDEAIYNPDHDILIELRSDVKEIKEDLKENYVQQKDFTPVLQDVKQNKNILYGLIALIVIAFVMALIRIVISNGT